MLVLAQQVNTNMEFIIGNTSQLLIAHLHKHHIMSFGEPVLYSVILPSDLCVFGQSNRKKRSKISLLDNHRR